MTIRVSEIISITKMSFPCYPISERRLSLFRDTLSEKDVFPRYLIRERHLPEIPYQRKTSSRDTLSGKDIFLRYFIRERRLSGITYQGKTCFSDNYLGKTSFFVNYLGKSETRMVTLSFRRIDIKYGF